MRIKLIKIKIFLFLSVLSTLLVACKNEPQAKNASEMPLVPVIAKKSDIKDVTVYLEAFGTLRPTISMDIRPEVRGTISEVLVKEGEFVKQGTPLFVISPELYEMKVKEAKAQLSMDLSGYAAIEKKMERFRSLAEKDLIAKSEWDDLETELARAKAMIELSEARLNAASIDLNHCTIVSPVNGRVGKLDVHPGVLVSEGAGTPLATIAKVDPLILEFHMTEKEYAKMAASGAPWDQANQEIELYSSYASSVCRSGTITFLDNHFDPKTGTLLVRANVPNNDRLLRPGQTVRVKVPISIIKDARLVPQKAIRYNQQGPYAYVVEPGNVTALRQLVLEGEDGSDQIVKTGIDENELVVIDGHLRLSPGVKVDVKE